MSDLGESVREAKSELQERLRQAVQAELRRFRENTGIDVAAVDVNICTAYKVGEPAPARQVGSVSVCLDI